MSFEIRHAAQEDYHRIVEIVNAQVPEPTTVEELLNQEKRRPADWPFQRLVAVAPNGEIAAFGLSIHTAFDKPGHFVVRVRTDSPYRGSGMGRALSEQLQKWAHQHGATHLNSSVRDNDPESLAWAERQGFVIKHHLFESTLDLTTFDPQPFMAAVEAVQASGIRLTTMAEENLGEEGARKFYDLSTRTTVDLPNWDGRPLPDYDRWREMLKDDPSWDPNGIMLAADGDRWVALAHVFKRPSGHYYNGYTATDRAYRGRNLALAVKIKSIEFVRSQGAAVVRTNNHSANAPMLAVNRKLGYVPCPGFYELDKEIGHE